MRRTRIAGWDDYVDSRAFGVTRGLVGDIPISQAPYVIPTSCRQYLARSRSVFLSVSFVAVTSLASGLTVTLSLLDIPPAILVLNQTGHEID